MMPVVADASAVVLILDAEDQAELKRGRFAGNGCRISRMVKLQSARIAIALADGLADTESDVGEDEIAMPARAIADQLVAGHSRQSVGYLAHGGGVKGTITAVTG